MTASAVTSFSFGAVGDLGGIGDVDMIGLAKRMQTRGVSFLLALGDLGYTSDEQGWCQSIKGQFSNVEVIAGNHDTTESGPGDIAQDVIYCPFTLSVSLTGGSGTPGYGYEYYFDYPAGSPFVRFILIAPGVTGALNYNFNAGSTHYNWVVDAINNARSLGIPWVIVGMHKQCITVGAKTSCSSGQAIFDKLVDLKVDLILQAHDHVYERSKQLALSTNCPTVPAGGNFDADCIVDDGASGTYPKGAGSVVVVAGNGGSTFYTVNIGGGDKEIGYFVSVMGDNTNTQGKTKGHGYVQYTVTPDRIDAETNFCPSGSPDSSGECASQVASTFKDSFAIASPTLGPTARFTSAPTWPRVNDPVSFDASSSTHPDPGATLEARWDWEDDGTWDTAWSTTMTAAHAYAAAGTYTARLEVRDQLGLSDNATGQVAVDGLPPVTTHALSGTSGSNGWYRSSVGVTLSATDDLSGIAATMYRLDSGLWQTYAGSVTVSGDGTHTVDYNSTDRAGNAEAMQTASVKIDATAPSTSHSLEGTLVNGSWYLSPVTVTLTASDVTSGVASIAFRVDGGSWVTYAAPVGVSGNGTHSFEYASTDQAGNIEPTRSVQIPIGGPPPEPGPGEPPVTTLGLAGSIGSADWYVSSVTVTLSATGPASGISIGYRLDSGSWQAYAGPFVVEDGLHVLDYNATDSTGAQEATKTASFKVDTAAPTTAEGLTGELGESGWYLTAVEVTLTAADATSGVAAISYRVDGGSWETYAAPISIGEGQHMLEYAAADVAGLAEVTHSRSVWVDLTGPVFDGTSPDGVVKRSEVEVSWTATDPVSGIARYEISVDGAPFASIGTNTTLQLNLADGSHYVAVRAIDGAGHAEVATISFRVDTNMFSLAGPYSGLPTFLLIGAAIAAVLALLLWRRRRKEEPQRAPNRRAEDPTEHAPAARRR